MPSMVRLLEAMPFAQRIGVAMGGMTAATTVAFGISAANWNSVGTYNGAQAATWNEASPQYMKFQKMNTVFTGAWK